MRLFFALEPDPDCKRAIDAWRNRVLSADGRPVAAANFHVTLAFLGDVDAGRLERLCDAADALTPQAGELLLDRVGWWPRAGIYWLGTSAAPPALATLAGELARCGQRVGAPRDRRAFVPHVTLYRECRAPPPAPATPPALRLPFDGFVLFRSERRRGGVRYEPVADWPAR